MRASSCELSGIQWLSQTSVHLHTELFFRVDGELKRLTQSLMQLSTSPKRTVLAR